MSTTNCPCGSGRPFTACCEPILNGVQVAETAETLMRARYTAYTRAQIEFLRDSSAPLLKRKFDEKSTREWAQGSEWHGLKILKCDKGGLSDSTGSVEFIAAYRYKEQEQEHHETATFIRDEQGRWVFEDGVVAGHDPIRRTEPKIGRNDPCPCGSGLKFKKCCALKSVPSEATPS